MKKVMVCMLLAMAAPAFAGNLDLADAIPWKAVTWGGFATVADQGNGVFNLSIPANGGSAGIFWRLPAYPSELISICGCWSGDTGDAGWAEVMMFTSTEGWSDADVIARIDASPALPGDVVAKKDSWDLNPPNPWGVEYITEAMTNPQEIHATCSEVIVALKVGSVGSEGSWATYDLTYVPEPAAALLLGLPLMLLRRRR